MKPSKALLSACLSIIGIILSNVTFLPQVQPRESTEMISTSIETLNASLSNESSENISEVEIPEETSKKPYNTVVVKEGDTLWDIAQTYDTEVEKIIDANGMKNDIIMPGQELLIPVKNTYMIAMEDQTYKNQFIVTATAYCPCFECCGKTIDDEAYGITASGYNVFSGEKNIIAADPDVLPLGTVVDLFLVFQCGGDQYIGQYYVEDIGGAVKGNRIDIFYFSHEEAINFGVAEVLVSVYN